MQTYRAFPTQTALFAAERPNLHIDRLATLRANLQAVLHVVVPRLDAERKAAIQTCANDLTARAEDLNRQFASASAASSTVEAERTLLVAEMLAASEVLLALGPNDALARHADALRCTVDAPLPTPNLDKAIVEPHPAHTHRIL